MRRIVAAMTAIIAFVLAAEAASAADLSRRPPAQYPVKAVPLAVFDWTGFYVGVNAGYGWGTSRDDFGTELDRFKVNGGLVGGTVGYNYQIGHAVLGIEGDMDWQDVKGSGACIGGVCQTKSRWLATARGRLGYAFDRFMVYGTGGAAFADLQTNVPGVGVTSNTRTGWTVGGGAEYAFAPNWSLKAEYLFADLGKFNCVACGANVKFNENIVRAGLNYKF
jgi:outer membrane immunogenic protein